MPPKTVTVTINPNDLQPNPVVLDKGDHVKWYNNSGVEVVLGLPPIFSPQGDPTIPNGQTSSPYTVNNNATVGNHQYSIGTTAAVPRNGTIDVT